jgi:hypothetical protein
MRDSCMNSAYSFNEWIRIDKLNELVEVLSDLRSLSYERIPRTGQSDF